MIFSPTQRGYMCSDFAFSPTQLFSAAFPQPPLGAAWNSSKNADVPNDSNQGFDPLRSNRVLLVRIRSLEKLCHQVGTDPYTPADLQFHCKMATVKQRFVTTAGERCTNISLMHIPLLVKIAVYLQSLSEWFIKELYLKMNRRLLCCSVYSCLRWEVTAMTAIQPSVIWEEMVQNTESKSTA